MHVLHAAIAHFGVQSAVHVVLVSQIVLGQEVQGTETLVVHVEQGAAAGFSLQHAVAHEV